MAFALVQGNTEISFNYQTITATGLNNLVVVHIWLAATETLLSVTDNVGNSYQIGTAVAAPGTMRAYQAYGVQLISGATLITATANDSSTWRIAVDEYSGGEPSNELIYDVRGTGSGTGTTLSLSSNLVPAASGSLIVATGTINSSRVWTVASGYTFSNATNSVRAKGQYKLSGTTSENPSPTIDSSADWAIIATAFKIYNPAPSIISFTPLIAKQGDTVTITGRNFTGATVVSFGGTNASSFNVVSSTSITAVVAAGTSGDVLVTTPDGTDSLAGFTFYIPSIITNIQTIYDIQTIKFN